MTGAANPRLTQQETRRINLGAGRVPACGQSSTNRQLTSYLGNMESSGVPPDKVRGILVAPSFSRKVLNSAAIEPRITLLRFGKVA